MSRTRLIGVGLVNEMNEMNIYSPNMWGEMTIYNRTYLVNDHFTLKTYQNKIK